MWLKVSDGQKYTHKHSMVIARANGTPPGSMLHTTAVHFPYLDIREAWLPFVYQQLLEQKSARSEVRYQRFQLALQGSGVLIIEHQLGLYAKQDYNHYNMTTMQDSLHQMPITRV